MTFTVTLFNYGSCFFTSKLYHVINGNGDDFSGDKFEIDSSIVSIRLFVDRINFKFFLIQTNKCFIDAFIDKI